MIHDGDEHHYEDDGNGYDIHHEDYDYEHDAK